MSFFSAPEPRTIDDDILESAVKKQQEGLITSRLSKLAVAGLTGATLSESISLTHPPAITQMSEFRLDFQNILKIDNLKPFSNLGKLQLDNNLIEHISNLDHLVNLKALDLSFNRIERIEGLDNLAKLEDLSLFQNEISDIGTGLEKLANLSILSLGNNKLSRIENMQSLSKLQQLGSLCMSGNPVAEVQDFMLYCVACVKNLKYFDYSQISEEDRQSSREKFEQLYIILRKQNYTDAEVKTENLRREEEASLIKTLHLEQIYQLMWRLTESPPLNEIAVVGRNELDDCIKSFTPSMTETFDKLKSFLLMERELRDAEKSEYLEALCENRDYSGERTLTLMKKFELTHHVNIGSSDTPNVIETLYRRLMTLENDIFEHNLGIFIEFEHNYHVLFSKTIDGVRQYMQDIRSLMISLHKEIVNVTDRKYDQLLVLDVDEIPHDAQQILSNKDRFCNCQTEILEQFSTVVDDLEESFIAAITSDIETEIGQLHLEEWSRNRSRIGEIKQYSYGPK